MNPIHLQKGNTKLVSYSERQSISSNIFYVRSNPLFLDPPELSGFTIFDLFPDIQPMMEDYL